MSTAINNAIAFFIYNPPNKSHDCVSTHYVSNIRFIAQIYEIADNLCYHIFMRSVISTLQNFINNFFLFRINPDYNF